MQGEIVRFENVSKKYPGQLALRDVSFQLPPGKIIGIVGPNGSGKSTSLKLMSGLLRPNQGQVFINGQPTQRRISKEVAYLSELDELYSFFTVGETLQFNRDLYEDFNWQKAQEMLSFMQLDPAKRVKELSKGNRGRLKIILTLARTAPLLLMDEPLSGLDPLARENIIKSLISYIAAGEQTVIMTTHEVAEVEPLLDMVVAIQGGQVLKIAEVEEIRSQQNKSLVEWMKETLV